MVGGGYYLLSAHGSHGNANGDKLFSLYRAKCLEQELQKLHYTFAVLKLYICCFKTTGKLEANHVAAVRTGHGM